MRAIDTWLGQPAAQAVSWALLQFVWQGAVVGALTALALLVLRRSAADARYVVSSIALALMLTLPVVTGVQKYQAVKAATASTVPGSIVFHNGVLVDAGGDRFAFDRLEWLNAGMPSPAAATAARPSAVELAAIARVFFVLWIAGVTTLTLRLLTGFLWVQRLRTHGVRPAGEHIGRAAARLAQRLRISRAVALLESSLVDVPTVIGFLKPVVLLPGAALAGLTPEQIEAILAHELAHIRRHDYLVNLLQTLVETLLFYHPAVWWLSRRIRIEREHCCDDLAVSLCGDPVAYAAALADLESLRSSEPLAAHHIAMAATGGSLLQRVRRLLGARSSHSGRGPAWLAGMAALVLVVMTWSGIAASADVHSTPAAAAPAAASKTPVSTDVVKMVAGAIAPEFKGAVAALKAERQILRSRAPKIAAAPAIAVVNAVASALQSVSVSQSGSDSHGSWKWSVNGEGLEVSYAGTFEFTDDDTDVRQLSAGGWLKISDGRWLGRHSVEIHERNGQLERHYYVNAAERPYEPEGHAWLRQNLPKFVRNTGIGAQARVARLLTSGGPAAVLTEIGRIESTYAKGIYFKQLLRQASLSPDQYRQVLTQASREMSGSSYELAQLLIAVSDTLPSDDASRAAYFQAAAAIHSDYELRRVYSTMLKRGPVSPAILGAVLTNARSIHSDYDLSELLRQIVAQQPIDERNSQAFFAAVSTIGSAYERHRVLSAVVRNDRPTDPVVLQAALVSATAIHSDYDTSTFLQEVLRQNDVEGAIRPPFFQAVATIGSAYEHGRVLQAVVRRSGTSNDTLRAVLQSSRALSGYELSQLLQLVARSYQMTGDLRDAYLDAADRLKGYDQDQVMTALVKSERRK
jgi:beta-lactamase regulating signal transducer with metallopeptidase domain